MNFIEKPKTLKNQNTSVGINLKIINQETNSQKTQKHYKSSKQSCQLALVAVLKQAQAKV